MGKTVVAKHAAVLHKRSEMARHRAGKKHALDFHFGQRAFSSDLMRSELLGKIRATCASHLEKIALGRGDDETPQQKLIAATSRLPICIRTVLCVASLRIAFHFFKKL